MPRNHGRILTSILSDDDFRTLSEAAQRLYMILLAQKDLSTAGIMSINYRRWARACSSTTVDHVVKTAHELHDRRYVILDEDTEEAFVRSLIRNDGISKQPQLLKNALRLALQVESPALRAELAAELRRLNRQDATETADEIDPGDSPTPPPGATEDEPNSLFTASPIQADRSLTAASAQSGPALPSDCAQSGGVGEGEGESLTSVATYVSFSSSAEANEGAMAERDDVEQLVARLSQRVSENEFKLPAGFVDWQRQARLLLDRDERDLGQALRLIDWATGHHFWAANIRSMGKFRQQYDQLLGQARNEHRQRQPKRTTDDKRSDVGSFVAQVMGTSALRPDLRAIEGGNQP